MSEEKGFIDYMLRDKDEENKVWRVITLIFWYRTLRKIPDFYRNIKWAFQRTFRANHSSDCDIWGLSTHLAPILLGKLKAFRDSPLHGFPCTFSEWGYEGCTDEHGGMGITKKEYDEAKTKGDYEGGEEEAWKNVLDEMVFAFDFLTNYEGYSRRGERKRDEMLARYDLIYPHQKIPENRDVGYVYEYGKGDEVNTVHSNENPEEIKKKGKDYRYLGETVSYYNFKLEREYYDRVQKGLDLFAKHFMSLWD